MVTRVVTHVYQLTLGRSPLLLIFCLLIMTFAPFSKRVHAAITPYDFGSFFQSPKSFAVDPSQGVGCENQMTFGISHRSSRVDLEGAPESVELNQLGTGYGTFEFGVCFSPAAWVSIGGYVNIATLSFELQTQGVNEPLLLPYNKNFLPLGALGIAVNLTESLAVGFGWRMIERIDIDVQQSFTPDVSFVANADVRPAFAPVTGLLWRALDGEWGLSYSPDLVGSLDVLVEVPDSAERENSLMPGIDLLVLNGAVSYTPARSNFSSRYALDWGTIEAGVFIEHWSDIEQVFLDVTLPLGLDAVLFDSQSVVLEDTLNGYISAELSVESRWIDRMGVGVAHRSSMIKWEGDQPPLVSGDTHLLKLAFSRQLRLFGYDFVLGGHSVLGWIDERVPSSSLQLTGPIKSFSTSLKIFF